MTAIVNAADREYSAATGPKAADTLDDRLEGKEALIEKPVRVTATWGVANERYSAPVTLERIDERDTYLTFFVRCEDGTHLWVHDVEAFDAPTSTEATTTEVTEAERLRANYLRVYTELNEFKTLVRDVAIRVAAEQGWCDDGLNAVLEELGLEPKTPPRKRITYTLEVQVYATGDGGENNARHSIANVDVDLDSDWEDVEVADYTVTDCGVEDAE